MSASDLGYEREWQPEDSPECEEPIMPPESAIELIRTQYDETERALLNPPTLMTAAEVLILRNQAVLMALILEDRKEKP